MTTGQMLWLIPVFPLAAFLVNGLLGRKVTRTAAHWVALAGVGASAVLAFAVLSRVMKGEILVEAVYTWIAVGDFVVPLKLTADSLTAVMLVVVTSVSFMVHLYSVGYMHGDGGYPRFFAYLSLFTFSMLMLVLAGNFLLLFVFWEAVGLCSYLLIGFWFHKKSAADAGKKAFLVNRVGDFGFVLGIFLIIVNTGTVDFAEVFSPERLGLISPGTATLICLLLFLGATGKSAQLPLHVWLPDAMEGPTPVSALIHAATMVTAGVYMVARCHPLFELSPTAMQTVAVVGTATALMAAAIAFTQTDLKRIMAYSTVSQLGYMFIGLGVGAYAAAIFHLFTHAFFKALLFLGSGSVMHAVGGDVDITRQGRLFGRIRWTAVTFIIGSLALAGFPFLAGFFSKEAILAAAYYGGHHWLFAAGMLAGGGTAFYVFRAVFSVFFSPREADALQSEGGDHAGHGDEGHGHGHGGGVHESPWSMLAPLVILAVLSVSAGYIHVMDFLDPVFTSHVETVAPAAGAAGHGAEPAGHGGDHGMFNIVFFISLAMVIVGIGSAWVVYQKRWIDPDRVARSVPPLYKLSFNKFYVDEIYNFFVVKLVLVMARVSSLFDLGVIDGIVNWCGKVAKGGGESLAALQSGNVRDYLFFMSLGAVAVLGVWLWL
jgi:NADH-quinone oxidoreductase subunit L